MSRQALAVPLPMQIRDLIFRLARAEHVTRRGP